MDELPLFNWIKINDGEPKFMRKNIDDGTPEMDDHFFSKIYDEYIADFGLSEMHLKLLKTMKKRALLEIEFMITRERFKLTEIDMEIAKLDSMMKNNGSGMTIEQSLIHMSKWMNTWINTKQISVREYFNLMNEFKRSNTHKNKN
jgi:hypothetical protein